MLRRHNQNEPQIMVKLKEHTIEFEGYRGTPNVRFDLSELGTGNHIKMNIDSFLISFLFSFPFTPVTDIPSMVTLLWFLLKVWQTTENETLLGSRLLLILKYHTTRRLH